jgi:hypothetical protein
LAQQYMLSTIKEHLDQEGVQNHRLRNCVTFQLKYTCWFLWKCTDGRRITFSGAPRRNLSEIWGFFNHVIIIWWAFAQNIEFRAGRHFHSLTTIWCSPPRKVRTILACEVLPQDTIHRLTNLVMNVQDTNKGTGCLLNLMSCHSYAYVGEKGPNN